ncbi:MAG TPA: TetR/AcrR family transcriptional regulator [Pyrinomonadaceae bacterium]|nr:TetR/AcrR family transcriptional regulator [Pyrinomonadaceae bacterium]
MQVSRHDQKLEFILRTAARIFAEKSYHSTSMRDISRATNVSLAGLYHYCRSKEELLFLIQDNCFGRVLERLEQQLQEVQELTNNRAVDLTVATYALFGMMNWIYNWYDPQGKLGVHELAQHLTQLFLGGFSPGLLLEPVSTTTLRVENLSIWNHGLNG